MIKGFLEYRPDSRIKAVILNQISPMIYGQLKPLIEVELGVKVLGYVPKLTDLNLESRHLGLVLPGEIEALKEKLNRLAAVLEETLDLGCLLHTGRRHGRTDHTGTGDTGIRSTEKNAAGSGGR